MKSHCVRCAKRNKINENGHCDRCVPIMTKIYAGMAYVRKQKDGPLGLLKELIEDYGVRETASILETSVEQIEKWVMDPLNVPEILVDTSNDTANYGDM